MTVAATLRSATAALYATSPTPRLDAEVLMAHALDVSRSDLLLKHMNAAVPPGYDDLINRRRTHEPVAYITGEQEFWGLNLKVTPDTLIPRPDSETLIEAAVAYFQPSAPQRRGPRCNAEKGPRRCGGDVRPIRILDLGTGSGALLLAALHQWPDAQGIGVDISPAALAVAQANAESHGLAARAVFAQLDWRTPGWTDRLTAPFDLILCNPPYVETSADLSPNVRDYEPHSALFAGTDGLDDYRLLMPHIRDLLALGGLAIFEIGAEQGVAVSELASAHGLNASVHRDLAGHDRAVCCTR